MFRWGLIGAGDIVRKRVGAALGETPGSQLLAVTRRQASLAQAFAASVGADRAHARVEELVADPDVDGVYVATPVHLHAKHAVAAAEAGKHVLCEKPMAMTPAECDCMIAACRSHGVKLGIAYYRHFYPIIIRIKELLDAGAIGRPVLVQVNAFERFNPDADDPRHWFVRQAESGGGPMFDFGCHRLEILLNLFDQSRAERGGAFERVTGTTANVVFDREVEDTATACLQFAHGPCAMVAVTHAAMEPRDTVDLYGTDGSLHVANLNAAELRILTHAGERLELHSPPANLHGPLVADFVAAVTTGREPAVTGSLGRAVAVLEEAIYGRASETIP